MSALYASALAKPHYHANDHGHGQAHRIPERPRRSRNGSRQCPGDGPHCWQHRHDPGAVREAVSFPSQCGQGRAEEDLWQPDPIVRLLFPETSFSYWLTQIQRALVGFLLSLMPLSCDLMGWRGAGLFGAATM